MTRTNIGIDLYLMMSVGCLSDVDQVSTRSQGLSSVYCFSLSVNHLSITHANIHFSLSVTMVTQIILFPNFVLCVNQLLRHD